MTPDSAPPPHVEPARLSALSFGLALALLLAIFLLLNPFWESETVAEWDENILWSYYPIPLLVALLLRLEGKLAWGPFWLESMKLTFVKFTLTFLGANLAWSWVGAPGTGLEPAPRATVPVEDEYALRPGPPAEARPPGPRGALTGRLLDAAGRPVAGALVRLDAERGGRVAPREEGALELVHAGGRLGPALAWVQTWRPVRLVSREEELHTVVVAPAAGGPRLFNLPLLAGGAREFLFPRAAGELLVTCSVHGAAEPAARLLVVDHADVVRTDPEGGFRLGDLPPGAGRLVAVTADGRRASLAVEVAPGPDREVELRLP
jgi:hypothetical protein